MSQGIDLEDLAGLLQIKKKKLRKRLREMMDKGWLTGWMDEREDCLFLSAADFRAAHNIPDAPQPQPAPEPKAEEQGAAKPIHLDTARRFAQVLAQEQKLMEDPAAAEELEKMQQTTESICAWLESHPESAPKARRFAEYYIPTTLKLLHTYNDVQGQRGTTPKAIRRDIGGILHTLNTAYENIYDTLLSDAALDVSSEIAALGRHAGQRRPHRGGPAMTGRPGSSVPWTGRRWPACRRPSPRSGPNSWSRKLPIMGKEWDDAKVAAVMAQQQKEASLLAGLLAARGFTEPEEALSFLAGEDSISDPMLMKDMDKACARIHKALETARPL